MKAGSILNTDTTINLPKGKKKENGEVSEAAAQTVGKVIKHRQTLGYVLEPSHLRVPFTGRRLLSKTSERVSDVFVFQFPIRPILNPSGQDRLFCHRKCKNVLSESQFQAPPTPPLPLTQIAPTPPPPPSPWQEVKLYCHVSALPLCFEDCF